jgi:tRNA-2-methylthio-N6-dimethylallyladenosine synthase
MSTFIIKTYGCAMNVYDSTRISDILKKDGWQEVDDISLADAIIFNTCSIREKAFAKVFSNIGRLVDDKKLNAVIGLVGCVASQLKEKIFKRAPLVSFVVGPRNYPDITHLIKQAQNGDKVIKVDLENQDKFDKLPQNLSRNLSATLAIQEGCNKFCTYCVVPYTRGREYSRPIDEVVSEARRLVSLGAKEIWLLGQNVNDYHGVDNLGKEHSMGYLLHKVSEVEGLARIRYTTSYPSKVDDDLVEAHASIKNLVPFINVPIQAGSDNDLKRMNRQYTQEIYPQVLNNFKEKCPSIQFTSDFIVGFPGETEEDFEETLKVAQEFCFINTY